MFGGNIKTNVGIHSSPELKIDSCANFKSIIEDSLRKVQFNDGRLLEEMEKFEKKTKIGKMPTYGAKDGHDDYMMAAIWGLYSLKMEIIDNYYDVKKTVLNNLGLEIPLYVISYDSNNDERNNLVNSLDNKFEILVKNYEANFNNLKNEVSEQSINEFIKQNNLKSVEIKINENEYDKINQPVDEDNDFHFKLFGP